MGTDVQERVRRHPRQAERYELPAHFDLKPKDTSAGEARECLQDVFDDNPNLLSLLQQGDAITALSELATNAILHAETVFRVTVTRSVDSLVIGVEDAVVDRWPTHRPLDPAVTQSAVADIDALLAAWGTSAQHLRGIYLVAALADTWGIAFSKRTGKKSVYMTFDMQGESIEQRSVPGPRPDTDG